MKRILLLCGSLLVLTAASAFAHGSAEKSGTSANTPLKLTYLSNVNVDTEGYPVSDNPYVNYLDKKFNVKIDIINEATSSLYITKLNTVMASGDLPDYVLIPNTQILAMWATHGMLQPLDQYIAQGKYLPTGIDKLAWQLSSVDGKRYAVPMERYDKTPYMVFVRKDWIQNLGIDLSKVRTVDQWHNMLKKFVQDDPNKDGKNDTYGIVAAANYDETLQMFLDAFGAAKAQYVNGEVLPNYVLPQYENWLKFMHKLYVEHILDPEYITNTGEQMWEKAVSGKYGMFEWFWSTQEYRGKGGNVNNLVPMKPPLKLDGQGESHYLYVSPVRNFISITTKADKAKTQRIMQMMDWALSDQGAVFVDAGLKGLDYTVANGQIQVKPRAARNWAWRFITLGIQKNQVDSQLQSLLEQVWGKTAFGWMQLSNQSGTYDNITLLAPYFSQLANYDFLSFERQYRDEAITGRVNIDSSWNDYIKRWRQSGGDQWIKLYTNWYKTDYQK